MRLGNGSIPTVNKLLQPLLLNPNYTMPTLFGCEVYLTFWGGSDDNHIEAAHELLSRSFFSTGIPESRIPSTKILNFFKARTWASPYHLWSFGNLSYPGHSLVNLSIFKAIEKRLSLYSIGLFLQLDHMSDSRTQSSGKQLKTSMKKIFLKVVHQDLLTEVF